MMQRFYYNLSDLEEMIPWEREIYVSLLQQYVKDENEKAKAEQAKMKVKA